MAAAAREHSEDETRRFPRYFALDLDNLKRYVTGLVRDWNLAEASTVLDAYFSGILVMNQEIYGPFPDEAPNLRDIRHMLADLLSTQGRQHISIPNILMVLNTRSVTIGLMTNPKEDRAHPFVWASKNERSKIKVNLDLALDWLNVHGRILMRAQPMEFNRRAVGYAVMERVKKQGKANQPSYAYTVYWTDTTNIPFFQEYGTVVGQHRFQELKFDDINAAENYWSELFIQASHGQLRENF